MNMKTLIAAAMFLATSGFAYADNDSFLSDFIVGTPDSHGESQYSIPRFDSQNGERILDSASFYFSAAVSGNGSTHNSDSNNHDLNFLVNTDVDFRFAEGSPSEFGSHIDYALLDQHQYSGISGGSSVDYNIWSNSERMISIDPERLYAFTGSDPILFSLFTSTSYEVQSDNGSREHGAHDSNGIQWVSGEHEDSPRHFGLNSNIDTETFGMVSVQYEFHYAETNPLTDQGSNNVPLPGGVSLLLSGLVGLVVVGRRKQAA
jgi:hypothetical protein